MVTVPLSNGVAWQFREAGTPRWRSAVVPGCVHRDLLRHGLIPDPFWARNEHVVQWVGERGWEYRSVLVATDELLAHERVELVADGLDTLATISVNGRVVATTDNMFVGVRGDIRAALRRGPNEIVIRFGSAERHVRTHRLEHRPREINDPIGGGTRLRKQQCQFGWDWAPRLVTAGIWRDLRIEAWNENRVVDVRISQHHARDGSMMLAFAPELARRERGLMWRGTVSFEGRVVGQIENLKSEVKGPSLWWPAGQGAQPLYEVVLELWRGDTRLDLWSRRIGLRTVQLERKRDRWGESFQFVVNGRPIFAKGASWIPAHSFVGGLTRADYEPLLRSAAQANMNMLRVWGGGVYEHECFYDLCDELGLLVWHDFMFACTLYPGDAAFLKSVRAEAEHQVRRLRHRACLALWCGNNELELLNSDDLRKPRQRTAYDAVFRNILPAAVASHDGVTAFWRSSPSQSDQPGLRDPERSGNTHYWDVWHLLKPVKSYEAKVFRFVAEFGMQSFPSLAVAKTFCPPDELNAFSPTFENHQKNPAGNKIILDYLARRYRFPKDYAALAYLSQLNQAHCMQVGVEHYRRHQPRCMGTLYWQLNDCWPVASWSSLEFGGGWKALHHVARRFYAPNLVSVHVPGDDVAGIGNRLTSAVRDVHLHTVCDAPTAAPGVLHWELRHLDGRRLSHGEKRVRLRPGESVRQQSLDLGDAIGEFGRDRIYLRIVLESGGATVSEETVFLCPPRMLDLPRVKTAVAFRRLTPHAWRIGFTSPAFQHRFVFELPGLPTTATSDNWFDLYPGREKTVEVAFAAPVTRAALARALITRSLVDSYA